MPALLTCKEWSLSVKEDLMDFCLPSVIWWLSVPCHFPACLLWRYGAGQGLQETLNSVISFSECVCLSEFV